MLTHAGLFEGYGGTTMAAALALGSLDTRWYSDIKPASVALLGHRLPDVPNLGDMTAIDYAAAPRVDVLTASWPCQPHSSAGKRLGEEDPRALWPHVARAIAQVRPRVFLGENVARVAGNGELRRVVRSLAELGYVGAWRCVRASDVGAPHRRDRCFVVAVDPAHADAASFGRSERRAEHAGLVGRPDAAVAGAAPAGAVARGDALTLFPTPCQRDGKGPSVRGARPDGARRSDARLDLPAVVERLLPTPTQSMTTGAGTSGRDGGLNLQTAVTLLPTPSASRYGTNQGGAAGRTGPVRESLDTMAKNDRIGAERWGVYADAIARWEPIIGRPAPDPTVISARTGRPQLAAPFVEWMMGLPAGWVTDVAVTPKATSLRNAHLSLLGDGVVPQQGAHAFRWMLADLAVRL